MRGGGDEGETTHDGQCCTSRQGPSGLRWGLPTLLAEACGTTPPVHVLQFFAVLSGRAVHSFRQQGVGPIGTALLVQVGAARRGAFAANLCCRLTYTVSFVDLFV